MLEHWGNKLMSGRRVEKVVCGGRIVIRTKNWMTVMKSFHVDARGAKVVENLWLKEDSEEMSKS